ncbi:MAG: sigma-54-dependent Fis family transcriptional regulator [Calditrichaceae bacterium]|nr:sigma-54-dependent Fis family transcriptional regulator [Calditrichaceae bacterium]HES59205.1 sigma-54-dependent Fis family transcriptional regulator [Caldithrix sp.]
MKVNLLIIDDEQEMLKSLEKILSRKYDFNIRLISDSRKALELVQTKKYDLILTDLMMKDIGGMDILKAAVAKYPDSTVIIISGYGTIGASVEAMREGAFDFIEKPFTSKKLMECIDRALVQTKQESKNNKIETGVNEELAGIIYNSPQMDELIQLVKKIAPGNMNVLITGESGTGKELFARAIHSLSKRSYNPFVPVNCGALPEHLFESELFGHERGAFTGAIKTKPGLLEFADQGTFFFDEIGDLSLSLQVKLLRMLEERKIRRVGGEKEISIDVRIIAATNKNLDQAVLDKTFREDLYYRLNTIRLEIPPLREHPEDILLLARHFLAELCSKNDRKACRFSADAEKALLEYPWAGNVREMQNIIGRAFFLSTDQIIHRGDLPIPQQDISIAINREILASSYKDAKEMVLEKFEVEYLSHYLKKNQGNISRTAEECGLDRRSIHRLINKYNIIYQE